MRKPAEKKNFLYTLFCWVFAAVFAGIWLGTIVNNRTSYYQYQVVPILACGGAALLVLVGAWRLWKRWAFSLPPKKEATLVAGLLGMRPDDIRIPRAFALAREAGMEVKVSTAVLRGAHPNSVLLRVEDVPFANDKIGPGAPPIRTDKGWLTLFHTVDIDRSRGKNGWEDKWQKRYCAGVMLLDPEDPSRVVGLCKTPLLAPETRWETQEGYRTNVIFPGGLVPEPDGTVKIYYGASDTVECLATARIDDLLALCRPAAELPGAGH